MNVSIASRASRPEICVGLGAARRVHRPDSRRPGATRKLWNRDGNNAQLTVNRHDDHFGRQNSCAR
jgi:hypothetical protein